jgi:hypothetical protein
MGSADRTGGPRLGREMTRRATTGERLAGFVLLCLFLGLALLLVGACNIQGFPPPPPGGGPGGGGGQSQHGAGGTGQTRDGGGPSGPGGVGAGGQDGNTACPTQASMTCVPSCAISFPPYLFGSCDQNGTVTCPAGYLPLAGCAPNACARPPTFSCCNLTTGAITPPPCDVSGLVADCLPGTVPETVDTCVPPSLGVTNCGNLRGQPCDLPTMRCQSDIGTLCECEPRDAGFIWSCLSFGDPVP